MENLYKGVVIFFSNKKGYGFITHEENGIKQPDLFVHYSDINFDGFKTLKKDQHVSYSVGLNKHGQLKAINVLQILE